VTKNSNGGANHQATGSTGSDRPKRSGAASASPAADADVQRLTRSLKVKEDEAPWTTAELREIGAFLRAEVASYGRDIEQAERELVALLHTTGDGAGDDQADAGARTFEREHEIALANNSRDMLAQTERALDRLAAGTYGECENCGNPIGKGRLQVFPRATLCMTCKTKQERH
jgi:DnaK suppressor protein